MGFGYPARSARRWRFPDKEVIDIDGDGSFLMNVQELRHAPTSRASRQRS
jgi:acetolactate synthase-1/2/3 large subunit